ncbi:hypothetical protein [Micromonospora sp. NPDC048842]|uniref:hypothetical protein n=1 Tax=unclassified Micromonospora TaxID=2617518 RepID=UPI0033C02B45
MGIARFPAAARSRGCKGAAPAAGTHAPVVPLFVDVAYNVHGSKAGGIFISSVFGYPSLVNAHVKP